MSELKNAIWVEKYRPSKISEIVSSSTKTIESYLTEPDKMPHFIFYSTNPGTGKTSTARALIRNLGCDVLVINSSDERGIDTVREKTKIFSMSLGQNGLKRCVFLDEADGLTKQAQDSLRNLMETYSDNCFFILSCNDINKIIKPLKSRCVGISFERPPKSMIFDRLKYICEQEKLQYKGQELGAIIEYFYPDIRSMINKLQEIKLIDRGFSQGTCNFEDFVKCLKDKNIKDLYEYTYSGKLNMLAFNKWFLHNLLKTKEQKYSMNEIAEIVNCIAEIEKYENQGANLEVIFMDGMLKIMKIV